jgi:hypothetical protein
MRRNLERFPPRTSSPQTYLGLLLKPMQFMLVNLFAKLHPTTTTMLLRIKIITTATRQKPSKRGNKELQPTKDVR